MSLWKRPEIESYEVRAERRAQDQEDALEALEQRVKRLEEEASVSLLARKRELRRRGVAC